MSDQASDRRTGDAPNTIINGVTTPTRIWLVDQGSGDVCWSSELDTLDEPFEAVEYVRADLAGVISSKELRG